MGQPLRNPEHARIDARKLRDYALSLSHETGRYKAANFAQMGYDAETWAVLEQDIRQQHLTANAERGTASPFGIKYTITAPLKGPNGATRWVTTVWIFRPGHDFADLVTIEPARRPRGSDNE
jgi:hypothetical protein